MLNSSLHNIPGNLAPGNAADPPPDPLAGKKIGRGREVRGKRTCGMVTSAAEAKVDAREV
jgi:hypothetical protein